MDPRLQAAIGNPRIQSQAGELVTLALRALDDLKQLDESLYERFVANRIAPLAPAASNAGLRKLWEGTFGGLMALLAFCRSIEGKRKDSEPSPEMSFEFGELESVPPVEREPELDLGSSDIGDLLEGIDEHLGEDDAHRWSKALETISSIEYGLQSQYADATARLNVALAAGEVNQVLGLLDDTQSSASEGVHALVSAVYATFLPEINVATVVPGYFTALGRALVVRRGLAQLATTLGPNNDVLQSDDRDRYELVLGTIRDVMRNFVASVVCRAMRAADRWQMVVFERELSEQSTSAARQTAEGLVKYLDSLRSINQREVLVQHDQRALDEMREAIASARQLVDLSPRTAHEMIDRAQQSAQRLRGRDQLTDRLLIHLERYASLMPPDELLARLEEVLTSAS
ncbi:MAG: hypothetical protein H0T89_09205 [Deltaproteobacteria bacterium]|nr:hypothetical protein [Deltaproteobacteria bacterium]MDQ3299762.1 hypothetical protein [Myxococcota bacterium]